jgi:glycosyltransferase involved in cell wall biosynthesis
MRVAIVHDYLTQRGGAERVVLAMARAFPDAPVLTSLFLPEGTFPEFGQLDVRPMVTDRIPGLRRRHRLALPLLAPAFSATSIDADVVVCSSSGWAHGVRAGGRKLVYCYNPARWLYQREQYAPSGSARALAATALGTALRRWDARSARTADRYVAISSIVRERIRDAYGIEADLLMPPVGVDGAGAQRAVEACRPGFVLCVSRLMAYKNVDRVIGAFEALPDQRLVVVGEGPERARLQGHAPANVRFAGRVDDAELRWLYANCRAVVAASYEDFGLTPLEAASFGKPAAALRWGGFLDTVVDGRTGVFFDRPEPAAIRDALSRLLSRAWDARAIADHASRFSEARFASRLRDLVRDLHDPSSSPAREPGAIDARPAGVA